MGPNVFAALHFRVINTMDYTTSYQNPDKGINMQFRFKQLKINKWISLFIFFRRLSDNPGTGSGPKKDGLPSSLSRPSGQRASSQPTPEVDPQTILKALFKSTAQTTSTTETPNSQATAFRIKI